MTLNTHPQDWQQCLDAVEAIDVFMLKNTLFIDTHDALVSIDINNAPVSRLEKTDEGWSVVLFHEIPGWTATGKYSCITAASRTFININVLSGRTIAAIHYLPVADSQYEFNVPSRLWATVEPVLNGRVLCKSDGTLCYRELRWPQTPL